VLQAKQAEPVQQGNPYLPHSAKLLEIKSEVGGPRPIKRLKIEKCFDYRPGQCAMLSLPGVGEVMLAISSSPTRETMEFGIMKAGVATAALHGLSAGEYIGVRGPYGNGFPLESWQGKNIVLIGGGIGITPVWSILLYVLDNRDQYGRLDFIYGARSSADLCYHEDLDQLQGNKELSLHLSIDVEEPGWKGFTGFVPQNLLEVSPKPEGSVAVTCGPPIMIKFVIKNLIELGFQPAQIFTTLERRMKCGIGKCGRCNIGELYVCKDGPVFSYETLLHYPEAME
jgi:sulfhydrogenase subunit gamma (sulfur reductase)